MATGDPAVGSPPARASGVVIPKPPKWHARLSAALIYAVVRFLDATLRYRMEDPSGALALARSGPVIFAIWHNRLALSLMLYRRYILAHLPDRRLAALVSASRDGGMLAHALRHFGVYPIRGSSSRRGAQAVLEMTTCAERGSDLAITPDGPRGPCYGVQDGVVAVAQLTGLPIVPVSFRVRWRYRFRSWDRFVVPLPFGRCEVRLAEVLRVPREASVTEREQYRAELERRLRVITQDD